MFTSSQIIDLPLKLDGGQRSQYLGIKYYPTFTLTMELKMRHTLCWSIPSSTPLEIGFVPLFTNVVLGSLKSFFQLDHHVDICLYLTSPTTLDDSRDISFLDSILMYFSPIRLLAS